MMCWSNYFTLKKASQTFLIYCINFSLHHSVKMLEVMSEEQDFPWVAKEKELHDTLMGLRCYSSVSQSSYF